MKKKIYTQFIFVLAIFFMANSAFAIESTKNGVEILRDKLIFFEPFVKISDHKKQDILTIHKKTKDGLDVYTFSPGKQSDKELLLAIENRLKVVTEGFISVTSNDENEVKIITNPMEITEEGLEFSIAVVIKIYGYYRGNYKIEE